MGLPRVGAVGAVSAPQPTPAIPPPVPETLCLNVCLLGDPGIGQSAILQCYRAGGAATYWEAKVESVVANVELDGETCRVRLVDNVGSPIFDPVRGAALATTHAVLLCFGVDWPESLASVENVWVPCLRDAGCAAPVILLGLRCDLRAAACSESTGCGEVVEEAEAAAVAERVGAVTYLECSTVAADTVHQAVEEALVVARAFYGEHAGSQQPPADASAGAPGQAAAEEAAWQAHERLNVPDDPRPLEQETLRTSLSMLGLTPKRQHAHMRLELPELGLTSVDAVRPFQHLQFVNLAKNQLKTLEPLGALRCLLHLKASFNLLIRTQSFSAPDALETVDMSYNLIGDLGNWKAHKYLRELNLRGNFISNIGPGLLHNKELRMLDLSENNLASVENLEGLDLRTLHLAQNRLNSLGGVDSLVNLQDLSVRHNLVASLGALRPQDLPRLQRLCVADNCIAQIQEVEALASFPNLCDLDVSPNPVVNLPYYRRQVLHRLPRLRSLDAEVVAAEEKVKADLIYGADVDERRETFEQLLPEENFVDRRCITADGIKTQEMQLFGKHGDATPVR